MFLLSFILPLLIAFLFIRLILPPQETPQRFSFVTGFLSIGIGLGVSSCISFFLLLTNDLVRERLFIIDLVLAATLGALLLYRSKANKEIETVRHVSATFPTSGLQKTFAIIFVSALALALVIFVILSWRNPHGAWDAFAIWNLRARFLFRGETHWPDAFSEHMTWSHVDYPLFIPTNVARGWAIVGNDTVVVPILLALLFTVGIVGLIVSSLSILRGKSQGYLAGSVLLGTPFYLSLGASQLADVPLAFFLLSSVALISFRRTLSSARVFFLAGLSAALSGWVKNEGLLFLASMFLSLAVRAIISKDRGPHLKEISYFSLGALPVIMVIVFFKTQFSPGNDIFANQHFHLILSKLTDLSRHYVVLEGFQRSVRDFGGWPFSMPIMLLFYLLVVGLHTEVDFKQDFIFPLTLLILMLSGYYFIYIITPQDLHWHIRSSLNRLLLQLWPATLFFYFSIVRTPEKSLAPNELQLQPLHR